MTKAELVSHLAEVASITRPQADSVLNELATQAATAAKAGEEFTLPDIGKLKIADRPARTGRNPATGATLKIAASKKVKFVVAKALKDAANSGKSKKK